MDHVGRLLRGLAGARSQLAYFVGDHGETASGFACTSRFDQYAHLKMLL
jgi:hypothetical protein